MKNFKRRRLQLYNECPRCYWCNRLTFLPTTPADFDKPLAATVDHLNPIYARPTRRDVHNTVLACNECNQARARRQAEAAQPKRLTRRVKSHVHRLFPI